MNSQVRPCKQSVRISVRVLCYSEDSFQERVSYAGIHGCCAPYHLSGDDEYGAEWQFGHYLLHGETVCLYARHTD